MRIFGPIDQFGFLRACSGVILLNCDFGVSKNGPPDAVIVMRLTWRGLYRVRPRVSSSLKTAWCSESSGRIWVLVFRALAMIALPSRMIDSLFARANGLRCLMARRVAGRPSLPEIPLITRSTFGSFIRASRLLCLEAMRNFGLVFWDFANLANCFLRSSSLLLQTSPYTLNSRLCFLITSRV